MAAVKVIKKIRYHDVTRVKTQVKTRYVTKTIVRYKYVTKVNHVTRVRTVVNHKVTYTNKVRAITVVRYKNKVVVRYKTVYREVQGLRYQQHPKTGRLAGPLALPHGAAPPVEGRFSIPRLGIAWAPVWARDFISNGDGSFRYDIVPYYGVTRFKQSVKLGQAGLSLLSGHDDVYGNIFRYLNTMRRGDTIQFWQGQHTYRYVVTAVQVVGPTDVRLLNAAYTKPTVALVSCFPYWVDSQRVVVLAQLQ